MKGGQTKLFSAITLIENICFKRISGFITVSPAILDWYKINLNLQMRSQF